MATLSEFATRGKVIAHSEGEIVFAPCHTNYRLHLRPCGQYEGGNGQMIRAVVHAKALKVYTVPSGGGFIAPLFGPPRTIQGRVLFVDQAKMVLRAGFPIVVELPISADAVDLAQGPIALGAIVNVVAQPGAQLEFLTDLAHVAR